MVERIQRGFDTSMAVIVFLLVALTVGLGMALSWFIFQPFKWLESAFSRGVRHGH